MGKKFKICPICKHKNSVYAQFCKNSQCPDKPNLSNVAPTEELQAPQEEVRAENRKPNIPRHILDGMNQKAAVIKPNIRIVQHSKTPNPFTDDVKPPGQRCSRSYEQLTLPKARLECPRSRWASDVTSGVVVGRSFSADINLSALDPENYISNRHARFIFQNGQWLVQNFMPTNNTYVNGVLLPHNTSIVLKDGDTIRLDCIEFLFREL